MGPKRSVERRARIERECGKLYNALRRIALYDSPEELRRKAKRDHGLEPEEIVEMAYENVLAEARAAIKGMRRPTEE